MSRFGWLSGSGMLAVSLILALPAAATAWVNDEAKLFSPEAVAQADGRIQDIVHHFHRDLTIDTIESIPADMQAEYQQSGKAKFFLDWADRRAKDKRLQGIYVLICKNPGHLEIVLDKSIREHGFTFADRDLLAKQMLGLLKEKRYDAALAEAVNFVDSRLRAHQGRAAAPLPAQPHPGGPQNPAQGSPILGWICFGVAALVGIWLVMAVVRMLFGGGRGYGPGGPGSGGYGPGGYGGGGGGGFLSSMLGGMFGAAAGNWIYDSFRGGGRGGSWGGGGMTAGDSGSSPDSGAGDFSGDPGGGGDFGGDPGGGGGDFGGGGGDIGGGGGDFGGGGGGGDF